MLTGDRDAARAALADVAAEIERLEAIFSLHRPDSQLSRLNETGALAAPASDLVTALAAAAHFRRLTEGAFDPAVQPLWEGAVRGAATLPVRRVRDAEIDVEEGAVRLSPGTRITLNGIAQGLIADRVSTRLRAAGFAEPVIDTGETRLPGAIRRRVVPSHAGIELDLAECAVATSAPGGLRLGARHHLFDPATGESPDHWRAVTVVAPDAMTADALSTSFAVTSPERIGDVLPQGCRVIASRADGGVLQFSRGGATGT